MTKSRRANRLLMATGLMVLSGSSAMYAQAVRTNPGFTAKSVPRNDDGSSALEPLGFTINLFGKTRAAGYVNNNGNITFDSALSTYTPFGLQKTAREIIAPFFADVDTRPDASKLVTYGPDTVNGHRAFGANYIKVGYFSNHVDKLNSFQVVLIEREDQHPGDFDIEFNYDTILWETGDASGGVNGFGPVSASAGWSNGGDTSYEIPGSLIPGAFLDDGPYSLVRQSITGAVVNTATSAAGAKAGRLIFRARDGVISPGLVISGGQFSDATVGVPYAATLGVSGATPPFAWTLQSDVVDPPGLTLSKGGVLSGTPTSAGLYSFTVGVSGKSEDGDITVYQRASINIQPSTLHITTSCPLPDATVGSVYSQTFRADGLTSGLLWSVFDFATLPPGMSMNSSSGVLSGTPLQAGTYLLKVRVDGPTTGTVPAQVSCRLNVNPSVLRLSSACSLSHATIGVPFSQTLSAGGGVGPYRFALLGQLPQGVALTDDGLVAGIPLTNGVWVFQVATTDAKGSTQVSGCTMAVDSAKFSTSACPLPSGTTGLPYTASLGSGMTWSAMGLLPAGLTLDPSGNISGTPMTAGAAQFRLIATNGAGQQSGEACSISILRGPLAINGCPMPDGRAVDPYSASLTGAGGSGDYLITALGQLPAGLVLGLNGLLSGTPTQGGTYPFTAVIRENGSGTRVIQACSVTIQQPQLQITSACPLPSAHVGEAYKANVKVAGGTAPYKFTFGLLPDGITGATDGTLSGTPLRIGGRTFPLRVTDAESNTLDTNCSVDVAAPNVPAISLSDLPATVAPATTNLTIGVQMARAYTAPIQGTLVLAIHPDTDGADALSNSTDPHLAFANGQTSTSFTIPAGATRVNVPLISTGTVASTVTVSIQNLTASGAPLIQNPGLKVFSVPAAAPQITSACYVRTATDNGIHLNFNVSGLTSTRELVRAEITIPGTANQIALPPVPAEFLIQSSDTMSVSVARQAQDFFSSPLNIRSGGAFTVVIPLDLTIAPNITLPTVSVNLFNSIGGSGARTVTACQ